MSQNYVKSERSNTQVLVRFINKTNRLITIVWIGFNGSFVPCRHLDHNQFLDINTFTTHPWIFIDSKTQDLMHVKHKDIFYPEPVYNPRTRRIERSRVFIHIPLNTLRTSALLIVRDIMKTVTNIHLLEIPEVLKRDLRKLFDDSKGRHRYILTEPQSD